MKNDLSTLANDLIDIAADRAESCIINEARRIVKETEVLNMSIPELSNLELELESLLHKTYGTRNDILNEILNIVSDELDRFHHESLDTEEALIS